MGYSSGPERVTRLPKVSGAPAGVGTDGGERDRRGRSFLDRYLWDTLTELDHAWLANHMQLVYDMAQLAGPRNPYQSGRR